MKILHLIPTYLPASLASGPIQPIHSLNKELVKIGVDVTVYTSNWGGNGTLNVPLFQEVLIDGVKVFYFPLNFKPWFYSRKFFQTLRKNAKNFDLIHISFVFLSFFSLGSYYARKCHIPCIVTPHGGLMKKPLFSKWLKKKIYLFLIEKNNLAKAEAIHFTTQIEKDEYLEMRLPLKRFIIIPHGISQIETSSFSESDFFRKKFKIPQNKKIILFLGRLNWIKGFDTLLPAFAEVLKKERETILVLAGPDGGYKVEINKFIEKLDLKEKVFYTGILEGKEKIAAFRESSVFVLSSYSENFSVVAGEAMNFGLPLVITKGIGIWPLVQKYEAGIVVEKNAKELSLALVQILQNVALAQKMGENGKKLAETEFNPKKISLRMMHEYTNIIERYK